ncbi:MAG: hypothetical protein KA783_01805 [Chitinophagales bacterium]|nr:hypothetical protein [Chitinophagales bacterium]
MAKLEQEIAEMLKERYRNRKIDNLPDHLNKLKVAYAVFSQPNNLKKGDIVVWKKGLKNKLRPAQDEPCIVIEVLDTPLHDIAKESGTAYFNEPLDLVIGVLDSDGDFAVFYYDKRRFELYKNN